MSAEQQPAASPSTPSTLARDDEQMQEISATQELLAAVIASSCSSPLSHEINTSGAALARLENAVSTGPILNDAAPSALIHAPAGRISRLRADAPEFVPALLSPVVTHASIAGEFLPAAPASNNTVTQPVQYERPTEITTLMIRNIPNGCTYALNMQARAFD